MKRYKKHKLTFTRTWAKAFTLEWKAIIQDKGVLSVFISMGIMLVLIYSFIYGEEVVREVPVAVIDHDFSSSSREFIQMVDAHASAKVIRTYTDFDAARADFYAGKVHGILWIHQDFGTELRTNRQPVISIYSDASNIVVHRAVLGSVLMAKAYFNIRVRIQRAIASGDSIAAIAPVGSVSTPLFNPAAGYGYFIVPIITTLVLQLMILLAIGILGGKNNIKWLYAIDHKILRPGGSYPILLGRASLYIAIFIVILPIQYGLIFSMFSFPSKASLIIIYLFNLPYIISLVFLGIFLSTFFKRSEDAILYFSIMVIPSMVLSGITFPFEGFSPGFTYMAHILPSTPGSRGMIKLTQFGARFSEVLPEWFNLWGLSLVFLILTIISLKVRAAKVKARKNQKFDDSILLK